MNARHMLLLAAVTLLLASAPGMLQAQDDDDAAKKSAEALPFDYSELVYLVVMDMVGPPRPADKDQLDVYLSIFHNDPTAELLQKLSKAGLTFRPGSTYSASKGDGTGAWVTVGKKFLFSVYGAERLGEDRYLLKASYYCGLLCAAEFDYILHFDGEKFAIAERTMGIVS